MFTPLLNVRGNHFLGVINTVTVAITINTITTIIIITINTVITIIIINIKYLNNN
jgi:hypothetical protein